MANAERIGKFGLALADLLDCQARPICSTAKNDSRADRPDQRSRAIQTASACVTAETRA
jgi:hypothetical protein